MVSDIVGTPVHLEVVNSQIVLFASRAIFASPLIDNSPLILQLNNGNRKVCKSNKKLEANH